MAPKPRVPIQPLRTGTCVLPRECFMKLEFTEMKTAKTADELPVSQIQRLLKCLILQ